MSFHRTALCCQVFPQEPIGVPQPRPLTRPVCDIDQGGIAGVVVRSKDTLRKLEAESLGALPATVRGETAVAAMEAAGVTAHVGVETQVRVPEDAGLAEAQEYGVKDIDGKTIPSLREQRGAPIWKPV